jgi:adenosylcobinamide-GDP ribazoletransferase
MKYCICFLPLVGAVIGAAQYGGCILLSRLSFGPVFRGAVLSALPVLLTGGIHMDGFLDTCDAMHSYGSREKKLAILKDPHVGAFAVMGICAYLIAQVALFTELDARHLASLVCVPIISRCLSGYATVTFKKASSDGMLAAEGSTDAGAAVRAMLLAVFGLVTAALVACDGLVGAATAAVAVAELVWVRRIAMREFGGMSGDLAGYYLEMAELLMLACIVVLGRVGAPWSW